MDKHRRRGMTKDDIYSLPSLDEAPWLILTHKNYTSEPDNQTFCLINSNKSYSKTIFELHGKSILASNQGWLVLQERDNRSKYSVWNPVTRQCLNLPELLDTPEDAPTYMVTSSPDGNSPCVVLLFGSQLFTCRPTMRSDCRWVKQNLVHDGLSVMLIVVAATLNEDIYVHAYLNSRNDSEDHKSGFPEIFARIKVRDSDGDSASSSNMDVFEPLEIEPPPKKFNFSTNYSCGCEFLFEVCGVLYAVNILKRESIVDYEIVKIYVWRMDLSQMEWIQVESLGDRAFLLGDSCCTWCCADDSCSGIEGNCIYITSRESQTMHKYRLQDDSYIFLKPYPDIPKFFDKLIWFMPRKPTRLSPKKLIIGRSEDTKIIKHVEALNEMKMDEPTLKVDQQLVDRIARNALIAKLFASISSIKAAYAQLQHSESPFDAEGIQSSDQIVISELNSLSELKQCFAKRQFDPFPEKALLTYEVEEQTNVLKIYEILGRKKDSEITFLKQKLEETKNENRLIGKRLIANLHMLKLSPNHFIPVLRHTIRSIRKFVRLMVNEMQSSGWNLDAAVNAIHPGATYRKPEHKCFTFESFVCKEMFDSFHIPNFAVASESLPDHKQRRRLFFERFTEFKSVSGKDYLSQKPKSAFGKFCRVKYLRVVHPKMESSFFGNLNQRNQVNSGDYPDTTFFTTFAEMAKRIWLLHCLAFCFEPVASIFQFKKGCRFSEVYMESVSDKAFLPGTDPTVAFTVVPGFKIGKTCIQSQVYLAGA